MNLTELLVRYQRHLAVMNKLRPATRRNYLQRLRAWAATQDAAAGIDVLTRSELHAYCMEEAGRVPKVCAQWVSAMRHFCDYLVAAGHLTENPAKSLPRPNAPSPPRQPVPDDVIRRLIDGCDREAWKTTELKRCRARAILCVLAYGALRVSELTDLRIGDVDHREGCLLVRDGKGGKARVVYLCREAMTAIAAYTALRPKSTHDYLFAHSVRQGMTGNGVYHVLAAVRQVANVEGHVTPHMFRHSSATRDSNAGVPLSIIQSKLGHSSPQTTARYLHTDARQQKAWVESNAIPRQGEAPRQARPAATDPRDVTIRQRRRRIALRAA